MIVYMNMSDGVINVELSPSLPEQLLGIEMCRSVQLLGGFTIGNTNIAVSTEAIAVYKDLFNPSDDFQSLRISSEVSAPIGEGYIRVVADRFSEELSKAEGNLKIDYEEDFGMILVQDSVVKFPQTVVMPSSSGKSWHIQSLLDNFRFGADTDLEVVEHTLEQHKLALSGLTAVLLSTNKPDSHDSSKTIYLGMPHYEAIDTGVSGLDLGSDGFEAFAGIDGVVEELREVVTFANTEQHILQNAGVDRTQAVLFYGPSGVGKTELMKTLVDEIGARVIDTEYGDLANMHVGEWAKNLDGIFEEVFNSEEKTAIIFDEFDGLTQTGNQGSNGNINAVLKRRLEQLPQHPNVFVFMATNEIDSIDPVVRADKRIPLKIAIGVPSQEQRKDIFKKLLVDNIIASIPDGDTDSLIELLKSQEGFDFERLAYITDQFTGGDISQVIKEVNKHRLMVSLKHKCEMPPLTMGALENAITRAKRTRP